MSEHDTTPQLLELTIGEITSWSERLRVASADLQAGPNPMTGTEAVVSLACRIASLGFTGMLGAAHGEIYAARTLARVISEHWVRLMSMVADTRAAGETVAGERFWKELQRAEAVKADQSVRKWFPGGPSNANLPAELTQPFGALFLDPAPTSEEQKSARATIERHSFKQQLVGLFDPLPTKTPEDHGSFGWLVQTYPMLSGCVHAGPDAHKWLLSHDWRARAGAAIDIAGPWASGLVFVRTHLSGGDRTAPEVVRAHHLTADVGLWYELAMLRATVLPTGR